MLGYPLTCKIEVAKVLHYPIGTDCYTRSSAQLEQSTNALMYSGIRKQAVQYVEIVVCHDMLF